MKVVLSSKLFWGYSMDFPDSFLLLSFEEQEQQVRTRAKSELVAIFNQHNLQILIDEVRSMNVHLHGPLGRGINYACDHVH